ncbi:MAG: SRPBCC family protein [Rhizobiaceae bacterium]
MDKAPNTFRIVTRWTVEATIDEVATILNDAAALPDWWSDVYLATEIIEPGDADGIGRKVAVHSKGWLPYHLNWTATLLESRRPHGWTIGAEGDLEGKGVWTLTQNGQTADIEYDWQVNAERPVLRLLSPVLGPLFAWNHRWAMGKGEEGLRREIVRRQQTAA